MKALKLKSMFCNAVILMGLIIGINNLYGADGRINLKILNSGSSEDRPLITADGKKMFLNSSKEKENSVNEWYSYDNYEHQYRYDFDIYYSENQNGEWSAPISLGDKINTESDDGVLSISPDGNVIYFVSFKNGWDLDGGPFYSAELRGGEWINVKGLGGGLSTFFIEADSNPYYSPDGLYFTKYISGASVSSDGLELFFATDVNRVYGKMDIWHSQFIDGKWSYPNNMGPAINASKAINKEPYISLDGSALFFSTNKPGGYGGYDLYYCLKTNGKWSKAVNLGKSVNTKFDDDQITFSRLGEAAYIVSSSSFFPGNKDVYEIKLAGLEGVLPNYAILKGKVSDKDGGEALEAKINIYNESLNQLSYSTYSNSITGEYMIVIPKGENIRITVHKDEYTAAETILSGNDIAADKELRHDFLMEKEGVAGLQESPLNENPDNHGFNGNIKIFPQPADETLNILIENPKEIFRAEIEIYNIKGEIFFKADYGNIAGGELNLDLRNIPAGAYIIKFNIDGKIETGNIIIR